MTIRRRDSKHRRPRSALWVEVGIPIAVLLAAVIGDLILPPTIVITSAFAIAPLAASALTTPTRTAAIAGLSVVGAGLSAAWNQDLASADWWIRLLVAAGVGAIAVLLCNMRIRREQALRHMTLVADVAQRALLRVLPSRIGSVGLAARYVSASEAAKVGGDLYEVADTPYGVRVLIGDVRGKGLDAVFLAATVVSAFRRAAFLQPKLRNVIEDLDAAVTTVSGEEDFVTALIAEFHQNGTATVVNSGHLPPLIVETQRPPRLLNSKEPDLPLGLGSSPNEESLPWPDGSRMLLYTDGLVETRNGRGTFFPLDDFAEELADGSIEEALDRLLAHLHEFSDSHGDDMALVLTEHRST